MKQSCSPMLKKTIIKLSLIFIFGDYWECFLQAMTIMIKPTIHTLTVFKNPDVSIYCYYSVLRAPVKSINPGESRLPWTRAIPWQIKTGMCI